jgi:hypothetical protein
MRLPNIRRTSLTGPAQACQRRTSDEALSTLCVRIVLGFNSHLVIAFRLPSSRLSW